MGKRSTSRRIAMQALYQADLSGTDVEVALKNIIENEKFIPETQEFARHLARSAWAAKAEIDKTITKLATNWPLDRIGRVDRSVLHLAIQELNEQAAPTSVVINEAVELAKKYSSEEAAKFINGILGAHVKKQDK